ncbi:MAG: hypothetical protein WCZ23_02290 [Rhodospirillaceae bacterium]
MTEPEPLGPLKEWFRRHFSDIEVLLLIGLLVIGLAVLLFAGRILAPLLLSGTMNLHPITIIVAILFFGAIWGF